MFWNILEGRQRWELFLHLIAGYHGRNIMTQSAAAVLNFRAVPCIFERYFSLIEKIKYYGGSVGDGSAVYFLFSILFSPLYSTVQYWFYFD